MKVGYIRVSATDQDYESQKLMMEKAGCEKIFHEKHTGRKAKNLEALEQAYEFMREGDEFYILRVDRLARDMIGIPAFIQRLMDKDIKLIVLTQNIDTSKLEGRILLLCFSIAAECEFHFNKERVAEARAVGKLTGRKKGISKEANTTADKAAKLYLARNPSGEYTYTTSEILVECKISKRTLYKYLRLRGIDPNRSDVYPIK